MDKGKLRKTLVGEFTIKRVCCSVAFIYVCLASFAYFYADQMIFRPQEPGYQDSADTIKIKTDDGAEISARYLPRAGAEFVVLFSHGNAEDLGDVRGFLRTMQARGYSVLAYDYRGYGASSGRASERNTYEDIDTVYEYLLEQLGVSADRIIVHGRSVGGAVAIDLAGRRKVAGLIVESSFVSALRVVTRIRLTPFDRFDNMAKIEKVACPVLFIHGKQDKIIKFWHGQKLFAAANDPKLNLWVDRAGHNDVVQQAGASYWNVIDKFTEIIRATRDNKRPVTVR